MRSCGRILAQACCALVLLVSATTREAAAQKNKPSQAAAKLPTYDVALDRAGTLTGVVTDRNGKQLTNAPVVVFQGRKQVADVRTDKKGRFQVAGLRGGNYLLFTYKRQARLRTWAQGTAPPAATKDLLVVSDFQAVRGQHDLGEIFSSSIIPATVVTAAAIAIPVAVSNNRDKPSGS